MIFLLESELCLKSISHSEEGREDLENEAEGYVILR